MENNGNNDIKLITDCAKTAARLTLQYGGGVHRAEDICRHVCLACGVTVVDISAVTTSVTITVSHGGEEYTSLARVERRSVDLSRLNEVNDVSRALSKGQIDVREAADRLEAVGRGARRYDGLLCFAAGGTSAFFSLLFGGGWIEFIAAFVFGTAVSVIISMFEKAGVYSFINDLIGGMAGAGLAVLCAWLLSLAGVKMETFPVIIGSLMPYLAGLSMTNAIRDTISGDYVSAGADALEAISASVAIAVGAAFIDAGVNFG